MEINYKKMLREIDDLVDNDMCFDVTSKTDKKPAWTQEEARWMSRTIGDVYSIAHAIHCKACQSKWITK